MRNTCSCYTQDVNKIKWTFPSPVYFHVFEIIFTFHMKNGMILEIDDKGNEVQVVVHVSLKKCNFI